MIGFAWEKNLPHGEFFEYFIKKLVESGVMNKMARNYLSKPRSDCATSGEFVSMGFTNTISAFVMLLVASMAALAICLAECLLKYWNKRKITLKDISKYNELPSTQDEYQYAQNLSNDTDV